MNYKRYLLSLPWRQFDRYPEQWSTVYLHLRSDKGEHKYLKVQSFNAVSFDKWGVINRLQENRAWQFSWLPADQIQEPV